MIEIELIKEEALDNDGNAIGEGNDKQYKRYDALVLKQLMSVFDSSKYDLIGYRNFLNVTDKIDQVWKDDLSKLELTLDEANFLKEYFTNINKKSKDGTSFGEFHIRTLLYLVDKLSE